MLYLFPKIISKNVFLMLIFLISIYNIMVWNLTRNYKNLISDTNLIKKSQIFISNIIIVLLFSVFSFIYNYYKLITINNSELYNLFYEGIY